MCSFWLAVTDRTALDLAVMRCRPAKKNIFFPPWPQSRPSSFCAIFFFFFFQSPVAVSFPLPKSQLLSRRMLVVAAGRGCSFLFLVSSGLRGTHQLSQARGLGRLRSAPGSPARPAARGADQLGLGWVGLDLGAGQCELCCCCCCAGGMRWCGLRLLPLVCLLVIAAAAEEVRCNIFQICKYYLH